MNGRTIDHQRVDRHPAHILEKQFGELGLEVLLIREREVAVEAEYLDARLLDGLRVGVQVWQVSTIFEYKDLIPTDSFRGLGPVCCAYFRSYMTSHGTNLYIYIPGKVVGID